MANVSVGGGADDFTGDILEEIVAEIRAVRCPVHGTGVPVELVDGMPRYVPCCDAMVEAINRALD